MKCPRCGHEEDKVIDSRVSREGSSVRRRRECLKCGRRFSTTEEIVPAEMYVIKRDERREEFNPQKIRNGIQRALWKRFVRDERVDEIMRHILERIEQLDEREIPSARIGEIVMDELKKLDEVAYVRFASVYREFKDIEQFINEIRAMGGRKS